MLLRENNIRGQNFSEFLNLLAQLKRGDVDGVRVRVGKLQVHCLVPTFLFSVLSWTVTTCCLLLSYGAYISINIFYSINTYEPVHEISNNVAF